MENEAALHMASMLEGLWADEALPALCDYIRIPNVSPQYCPTWATDGHMDEAAALLEHWATGRPIDGLEMRTVRLPGRTPVLLIEIPATGPLGPDGESALVYGHFDKQPGLDGWSDGLGPFTPVVDGERLYGRGSADDGYALFSALCAVQALRDAGVAHHRVVVLVEGSEESGSVDLPAYLDHLAPVIGTPSMVVGLDSEAPTYDRLWATTSLRGLVSATLRVTVLTHGVHSGLAGGVVPSSFRIARQLLDRVEDAATGAIRLPELQVEVPAHRRAHLHALASVVDVGPYPVVPGLVVRGGDAEARLAAVQWGPALEVTGADGFPPLSQAGNVLRPSTALRLSLRLPPPVEAAEAADALRRVLEADPPDGAEVTVEIDAAENGWDAPEEPPWLADALDAASRAAFGMSAARVGVGGTIPFIAMLGRRFPSAGIVVTGALGADSNAHGPDEYLHLPTARRVTAALALLLAAHAEQSERRVSPVA